MVKLYYNSDGGLSLEPRGPHPQMILFQTEQNHPFFQRGGLEKWQYQGLDSLCLRRVLYLCERRDGTLDGNEGVLLKVLGFIWFGAF